MGFVKSHLRKWDDVEVAVSMTCGYNMPSIAVKVYEFVAQGKEILVQIQYFLLPKVREEPMCTMQRLISHYDDSSMSACQHGQHGQHDVNRSMMTIRCHLALQVRVMACGIRENAFLLGAELDRKRGDEHQQLDEFRESLFRERHHVTVLYREIVATQQACSALLSCLSGESSPH